MDRPSQNAALHRRLQVCALKYCLPEEQSAVSKGNVILLAVKDGDGVRFYLHRSVKQQICEKDHHYFDALMKDLLKRLKRSPGAVFEQLSSLAVGPIVTDSVEWIDVEKESFGSSFYLYSEEPEAAKTA